MRPQASLSQWVSVSLSSGASTGSLASVTPAKGGDPPETPPSVGHPTSGRGVSRLSPKVGTRRCRTRVGLSNTPVVDFSQRSDGAHPPRGVGREPLPRTRKPLHNSTADEPNPSRMAGHWRIASVRASGDTLGHRPPSPHSQARLNRTAVTAPVPHHDGRHTTHPLSGHCDSCE